MVGADSDVVGSGSNLEQTKTNSLIANRSARVTQTNKLEWWMILKISFRGRADVPKKTS